MVEQRDGPLIPIHPWVTKLADDFPLLASATVEFYFELAKRITLVSAIKIAATSAKSPTLGLFANLSIWMLGFWVSMRLGAPLQKWSWNLTLKEKRELKFQALFWLGLVFVILAGIVIAGGVSIVISNLEIAARVSRTTR